MTAFGIKFGRLLRAKRRERGLTQPELAKRAFGDSTYKSRISELENEKVLNPREKTVGELATALNITEDEIDACRYTAIVELPRGLLENLVQRFGFDDPDAPIGVLEEFLKQKARDYQDMQRRLERLAKSQARISNLIMAATDALESGDFDKADARLADAEEIQQAEHTLIQVRKQAELRVERAHAALLSGQATAAVRHFKVAAEMFSPFDEDEERREKLKAANALKAHGLLYDGEALFLASKLYQELLAEVGFTDDLEGLIETKISLAVTKRNIGSRSTGFSQLRSLWEAVKIYRSIIQDQRFSTLHYWKAVALNNLSVALQELGMRSQSHRAKALLSEAIVSVKAATKIHTKQANPERWAFCHNNLGNAQRDLGKVLGGIEGVGLVHEALASFKRALTVHNRKETAFRWAETKENIGWAYEVLSEIDPLHALDHLDQAIQEVNDALVVFSPDEAPYNHEKALSALQRMKNKRQLHSSN